MGTRGVCGFVVDGVWKVTYNHFDSYPEGLGMEVLEFCKSVKYWDDLKEKVRKVVLVDQKAIVPEEVKEKYAQVTDLTVSTQSDSDWYCVLRRAQGAEGLFLIATGELEHMIDSADFMGDGLFCEWAYVIDLDEMVLRVYKAKRENQPDPNNVLPPSVPFNSAWKDSIGNKWYPVVQLYAYDLHGLPKFMLGVTNEFKKIYKPHSFDLSCIAPTYEPIYQCPNCGRHSHSAVKPCEGCGSVEKTVSKLAIDSL